MYSPQSAVGLYDRHKSIMGRGPRTERDVLQRVTDDLRRQAQRKATSYPDYVAALGLNKKLWTLLAADVAEPGNTLPADLRARLFYLAEFVQHHTSRVLRGEAEEGPLLEVNEIVLQAL